MPPKIQALIACKVTRDDKNPEQEIKSAVKGLITATGEDVKKHNFHNLHGSPSIYTNDHGLSFLNNLDTFINETQKRFKASVEAEARDKVTIEELRKKEADRELTMQPLQPIGIGIRRRFFANYRERKARNPMDSDTNLTKIGNEAAHYGNVKADITMIKEYHRNEAPTFHELYGITHDTDHPCLGIYSSPLQFLHVY